MAAVIGAAAVMAAVIAADMVAEATVVAAMAADTAVAAMAAATTTDRCEERASCPLFSHSSITIGTMSPALPAGARGGRTIRASARAKTLSIDESWRPNGATKRSPSRVSSRART